MSMATPTPNAPAGFSKRGKSVWQLVWGIGFLAPNILGFATFTAIPLVFAIVLAFTDWNLRLHNQFAHVRDPDVHIKFVGLDNFTRLLSDDKFYQFLGNTLFLMMGMPFGIAASLLSAMMLSKDLRGGSSRVLATMLTSAVLIASVLILAAVGMGQTAMTLLLLGMVCAILISGVSGGTTIYRTLFYIPNFCAGVATLLLWKKLYNPANGPINVLLNGPISSLDHFVRATPPALYQAGAWLAAGLVILLAGWCFGKFRTLWADGDLGWAAAIVPGLFILTPVACVLSWWGAVPMEGSVLARAGATLAAGVVIALAYQLFRASRMTREFLCPRGEGLGGALMLGGCIMFFMFVLIGLGAAWYVLPEKSAAGSLSPPNWLKGDGAFYWAKPAMILIGFWGAVGSNTMLLYLAALTNVPAELYEAADIDGASRFTRFWNVTWPQLAPTTFFIVVMGVIGGLQSGFESAKVLTQGGPAGSTTTLAYFIYSEGFETGRLGFSSAVAWMLFLLVISVTLFNWKFGNRYVND